MFQREFGMSGSAKKSRKWYEHLVLHKQMYDGVIDIKWFALFGMWSYTTHVFALFNMCNASGKAITVCM